MEKWKPTAGFEKHEVSNAGRIRNIAGGGYFLTGSYDKGEPFEAGARRAPGPRGQQFAGIRAEAEAPAECRLSSAGSPRRARNITLGEVAFGVGSEAGAWDRVIWDDHLSEVQVQEGPGLRGSHAGYTDSSGAHAQESGGKTVGARTLLG